MKQLDKNEAIAIFESKVWENWSFEEKVRFQLFQDLLCIPFTVYHEAIEKVLNRGVFTHEFAFRENLIKEYLGVKQLPTFEEIISLIPKDKRVVIVKGENR